MSEQAHEAAAGLVQDMFQDEPVEAEEIPSGQSEPVAENVQHETDNLNPDLPDELREMLDEPDFDAEAVAETQADVEEYEVGQYDDPALAEERRKRIAAEKKSEWYEKQRLVSERAKWKAEIEKYAPLADADSILESATSRRAALRAARDQHTRLFEKLKPHLQSQQKVVDDTIEQATVVAREEVQSAWGRPLTSAANAAPTEAMIRADDAKKVASAKTLQERIRARIQGNDGSLAQRVWED